VPVERLQDPNYAPLPRYWVPAGEVDARLEGKWDRDWLLGWRDITNATNERTVIATVFPKVGVGHKILIAISSESEANLLCLQAAWTSFPFDYLARQKIGGTSMAYFVMRQLPVTSPGILATNGGFVRRGSIAEWISGRCRELNGRLASRRSQQCGWDLESRFRLRCELDAAFFHLYGICRDDVYYIMDTFPIVKRKDEKEYEEYRTKRVILEIYDEMAASGAGMSEEKMYPHVATT